MTTTTSDQYRRGYDAGKRGQLLSQFRAELKRMKNQKCADFVRGFMDGQRSRDDGKNSN